jgi:hypothetical protein
MNDDELRQELARIQEDRRRARPQRFRPSRLDPYRPQIEALADAGGSREDIRIWLRRVPRIEVTGRTVSRALRRWKAEPAIRDD